MTEDREAILVLASRIPLLILKLGACLLRLAFGSRRSVSSFRKALKRSGVDSELARKLTDHYRTYFSIRRFLELAMSAWR